MENYKHTFDFLVIIFTLVLFILSITIILLVINIQNQKRVKHLINDAHNTTNNN